MGLSLERIQQKLMFSMKKRNVFYLFFLLYILFTNLGWVKVRIPNKYRPLIINREDWSIIHYYNTRLHIHTDVLLSLAPITNQRLLGRQSYVCSDSAAFSLGRHQMFTGPGKALCWTPCSLTAAMLHQLLFSFKNTQDEDTTQYLESRKLLSLCYKS